MHDDYDYLRALEHIIEKRMPVTYTDPNATLGGVEAGQVLWTHQHLTVEGDVAENAIIVMGYGGANLTVHGKVKQGARIFVHGGGAEATFMSSVSSSARVHVFGGCAKIYTKESSSALHVGGGSSQIIVG